MQDTLPSENHINKQIRAIYHNIRALFHCIDKDMMKMITTVIRPRLEYAQGDKKDRKNIKNCN